MSIGICTIAGNGVAWAIAASQSGKNAIGITNPENRLERIIASTAMPRKSSSQNAGML